MDSLPAHSRAEIGDDRDGNDERSTFLLRRRRQTHGAGEERADQLEELFRRCGDYRGEWPDQPGQQQGKRADSYGKRADFVGIGREDMERNGATGPCENSAGHSWSTE